MLHHVRDLSSNQRQAIESLLGRALRDEESVLIRPSVVLKEAPADEERARLVKRYQDHLDQLAKRVGDIPDSEIDAAITEAIERTRLHRE